MFATPRFGYQILEIEEPLQNWEPNGYSYYDPKKNNNKRKLHAKIC